jgi:hypothetical protein
MSKVFFVVEKNHLGEITPCLYHDAIPTNSKSKYVWGMRLDALSVHQKEKFMNKSLKELYDLYLQFNELGSLPTTNITNGDYFQSSKG